MDKKDPIAILMDTKKEEGVILDKDKLYLASRITDNVLAQIIKNIEKKDIPELFFYFLLVMQDRCNSLIDSISLEDFKVILEG